MRQPLATAIMMWIQKNISREIDATDRYFDTFEKPVRYGFGFGLSYTQFSVEFCDVQWISGKAPSVQVTVEVRSIGSRYSGKEVVQMYASCPQAKLPEGIPKAGGVR